MYAYVKKIRFNRLIVFTLIALIVFILAGCNSNSTDKTNNSTDIRENTSDVSEIQVEKGTSYSSKDEVARYIHQFNELPPNYITKDKARELGWDNSKGNLWEIAEGKSIGGDTFGNREGLLPKKDSRHYFECDINYNEGFRGSERIVYSDDGLIFYTADHYRTFERLY